MNKFFVWWDFSGFVSCPRKSFVTRVHRGIEKCLAALRLALLHAQLDVGNGAARNSERCTGLVSFAAFPPKLHPPPPHTDIIHPQQHGFSE